MTASIPASFSATKPTKPPEPADLEQILAAIKSGVPAVIVTGPAGCGKTTAINGITTALRGERDVIITAPTGIAALQAGGVTLHSAFKLPCRVLGPRIYGRSVPTGTRPAVLVIDEISMVRADLLDAVDRTLQRVRRNASPFGGVTLVAIGDPAQLPPVLTKEEAPDFRQLRYESRHFFASNVIQENIPFGLKHVRLETVHRQTDPAFTDILNAIRLGWKQKLDEYLPLLNTRVVPHRLVDDDRVTLCARKNRAAVINDLMLGQLPGDETLLEAEIEGSFEKDFGGEPPTPEVLRLKKNARVIFCQNGVHWVNGTTGIVEDVSPEKITVRIARSQELVEVTKEEWRSYQYQRNSADGPLLRKETGLYRQFPLLLAWAITIHRSQGLTLNRIRIDLGDGAFDYGQVYVALSRCPTLDGIELAQPIRPEDVLVDRCVFAFFNSLKAVQRV